MHLLLTNFSHLVQLAVAPTGAGGIISSGAAQACGTSCGGGDITKVFGNLTRALIFLIGSISVVMIIVGGLRYVLSNGDSKGAESARNTILYAVIGVIIAISALGIVNFVTSTFGK
jgi:hypothetical protein